MLTIRIQTQYGISTVAVFTSNYEIFQDTVSKGNSSRPVSPYNKEFHYILGIFI